MEVNLILKKISILSKRIFLIPKEILTKYNLKKYSAVFFISDNASWATDKTTISIIKYFKKMRIKSFNVFKEPDKQYVFYTNQYSILKKDFSIKKNVIAIDYQHGISKYLLSNKRLLNKIKKFQDNIKIIRVTNSYFKNYLIKNGVSRKKIFQIPLTVDTKLFKKKNKEQLRKKYSLPQKKILIGSFHKDGNGWDKGNSPKLIKGPDIFVKTLKHFKKKYNEIEFEVVLTAPARGYVKQNLKKLNIKYHHKILNEFKQLPNLYNCLDLYLITSRDEGGPNGIFEAMACGVPVVSTKVGLAHDHIKNGYNGFKCHIEDYKQLSKYCYQVISNQNLKKKIEKNSVKTAKKNNFTKHLNSWKRLILYFLDDT